MDDATQAALIADNCHSGDREQDHETADRIVIETLRGLGFNGTADAWLAVGKWYS